MKINLPVTQVERSWIGDHGRFIVSKTDVKGVITYINDLFEEMSGFTRDELIGESHNIVRHPDMPPQAFSNLWNTLKEGRPWRGIVKNRCKNGDHYWVDAFVSPLRKNGETVGYISVRKPPSRKQIQEAEALYARLKETKTEIPTTGRWQRVSLRTLFASAVAIVVTLFVGGGVMGVGGLYLANRAMVSVYEGRTKPINTMSRIQILMSANFAQASAALQHDPVNPLSKLHDHAVTKHTETIAANREAIDKYMHEIEALQLSAEERRLADGYRAARDAFVKDVLSPMMDALRSDDYRQALTVFSTKATKSFGAANAAADSLLAEMLKTADKEYAVTVERYELIRNAAIAGILASIVFIVILGGYLNRRIVRPIGGVVEVFDRITGGNLCNDIDISRGDEIGTMQADLATMQAHLAAMIDEVDHVSATIERRSQDLNRQMAQVAQHSEAQGDRVKEVASAAEEVSQSIHGVTASANDAFEAAFRSQGIVETANDRMGRSMDAASRVVAAVAESTTTMDGLRQTIGKIGDITQVIREIADQTNLLALNAAIEAARAGEQGRGFAVVADEVRKLAERTAASTADIVRTVETVQQTTNAAADTMESARTEVENSIGLMRESMDGLREITEAGNAVTSKSQHIAAAVGEQSAAIQEIAKNMERITALIDDNADAARHALGATGDVVLMAERLNEHVNFESCAG